MADCSELRRLLAKIRTAPSQDHRDAIRRIAQLEAAIQELIEDGSMDEKDMLFAYAALAEGKGPAK